MFHLKMRADRNLDPRNEQCCVRLPNIQDRLFKAHRRVASQFFSGKPGMISRDHFVCPVPSFSEMKESG